LVTTKLRSDTGIDYTSREIQELISSAAKNGESIKAVLDASGVPLHTLLQGIVNRNRLLELEVVDLQDRNIKLQIAIDRLSVMYELMRGAMKARKKREIAPETSTPSPSLVS
jgi:hypothetical protein